MLSQNWVSSLILLSISFIISPVLGNYSALQTINRPTFDFSSIGNKLEFVGNFDSVSLFNYSSQQYLLTTNISSFNSSLNTLYYQDSSASIFPIGDLNGHINIIEPYSDDSFILSGDFNQVTLIENSTSLTIGSLALFNASSGQFLNLDPNNEIMGQINVVYGDSSNDLIYIGGKLSYKQTHGSLLYNLTSSSLSMIPFKGFNKNSLVNSISRIDDNIIFGGYFYELGVPELQYTNQSYFLLHKSSLLSNSSSSDNSTEEVEIHTEQLVSFKYASFQADNTQSGSINADEIICPSDSQNWMVNDGQLGAWLATLPFSITPSKIRVYNARGDNMGVKTFRLYTSPSNSIMNLTYIDPSTGKLTQCDAWCPLLTQSDLSTAYSNINDSSVTNVSFSNDGGVAASLQWSDNYQDFAFVNDLEVNYLNFHIIDFYGTNAGLNGIQMFSTQILTFANDTLNEASCGSSGNNSYSTVSGDGWDLSITGQFMANSVSDVSSAASNKVGVTFYPNISYSGNYSIDYITPGCQQDGTCSSRGSVDISLNAGNGTVLKTFNSAQTNQFEKIENVWNGHLNVSGDSRPYVQLTVSGDNSGSATIVADKIAVTILGLDDLLNSTNSTLGRIRSNSSISFNHSDYKIPLNGLFEYSLDNFTSFPSDYSTYNFSNEDFENKFVGNSSINQFGATILPEDAHVNSIEYINETLYVSGDFVTNNDGSNFVGLVLNGDDNKNNLKISSIDNIKNGLNGEVNFVKAIDNLLFVGGEFNGTTSDSSSTVSSLSGNSNTGNNALTKIAVLSDKTWYSLDSGITNVGEISYINKVSLNNFDYFVLYDSNYEALNVWNNSGKSWFSNDDFNTTGIYMNITASSDSSSSSLLAGHLALLGLIANSGASINQNGVFSKLPLNFNSNITINQVLYINDSYSVIGGNFTTTDNKTNLVILNKNNVSELDDSFDWGNSSVKSLSKDGNNRFLFIGLDGTATIKGDSSNVIIYDMTYKNFSVPGAVSKSGNVDDASINAFYFDQNKNIIYVGGDFDAASALPCQSFCSFSLDNQRWTNDVSTAISSGVINYMNITSSNNDLLIGGKFSISDTEYYFTNYDFGSQSFKPIDDFAIGAIKKRDESSSSDLLGEVDKYILVDGPISSGNRMLVMGSNFISGYNKTNWNRLDTIGNEIDTNNSKYSKFQLIDIHTNKTTKPKKGNSTTYFDSTNQALLVVGQIVFKNFNNITMSAAIFNGSTWSPYLYTTSNSGSTPIIKDFLVNKALAVDQAETSSVKKYLDRGFVVLIGLALALGTMMLLVGISLFFIFWKNRSNGEEIQRIEEDDMVQTVPPDQLLSNMDEFKFTNEKL